ncbi:MAG TPA: TetR/AcrR family transcriptional regulator, partial [Solirubrobacteraceae bacterium]
RLRHGRAPLGLDPARLASELAAWASCYPVELPTGLARAPSAETRARPPEISERALRAEGRLPSGRHDLSREFIVKNQRERIVDATASIVAEKGLSNLTIPEIAKRANVSHHTFYEMYPSKHDAFLGALKVGMHQALLIVGQAYDTHEDDWPQSVAAGLRALLHYLASEPAHSHLILVDTFAASPEAIETRDRSLHAFAASYLQPGYQYAPKDLSVPGIAPEAITGGIWQVLHHYVEDERTGELPMLAPQLIYAALTPFLGAKDAAKVAQR